MNVIPFTASISATSGTDGLVSTMLAEEIIGYTIPEKPNSRLQKYRLTAKGRRVLKTQVSSS